MRSKQIVNRKKFEEFVKIRECTKADNVFDDTNINRRQAIRPGN